MRDEGEGMKAEAISDEGGQQRELPEIETARLRLRQFVPEDAGRLATLWSDPEVLRYIGTGEARDEAYARSYLEKHARRWREHGFGAWAVESKPRAEMLIGWCGLQYLEDSGDVEVGYGFSRDYWGQGMASEAARACLRFGFEDVGLARIVAVAYPENTGSRRVMEKVGMKYVKDAFFYGANIVYYSITRADFDKKGMSDE